MGFFRSNTTTTELPTAKNAESQRPPSYASSKSSINNDMKAVAAVGSNCPCHARYRAIKNRIEDVSKRLKKTSAEPLEMGRLAALMGIVNAPVEACEVSCCCHDEMQILAKELKSQDIEHERTREAERYVANQMRSFEAYAGEIRFLCGMLRECKGNIKPLAPSADVAGALRSAIQRLEVKVEVLKNRVHELELKEGI